MRIIGAGFGRTGTTSLKEALEELGFGPCYHMIEVFKHPEHAATWQAAWRGEPVDWEAFLGEYEATVDWPSCTFYEGLMEKYPDAQVLLSVRDPDRWYESTKNTIYGLSKAVTRSPVSRAIFGVISLLTFGGFSMGNMVGDIIWEGTFHGRFEDEAFAKEVFTRHNEEVKRRVPPGKLLVYEVKEGWGPLCEFLGVEVPDMPFPHLNDAARMQRGIQAIRVLSVAAPAALTLLTVLTVGFIWKRTRPQGEPKSTK